MNETNTNKCRRCYRFIGEDSGDCFNPNGAKCRDVQLARVKGEASFFLKGREALTLLTVLGESDQRADDKEDLDVMNIMDKLVTFISEAVGK